MISCREVKKYAEQRNRCRKNFNERMVKKNPYPAGMFKSHALWISATETHG